MLKKNLKQSLKKVQPDKELQRWLEYYIEQGFSFIPLISREKKPSIEQWEIYQKRRPTQKEIEKWFHTGASYNIGIIGGAVSGNLVVLDFEDKKVAYKIFGKTIGKETFVVETSNGLHIYWRLKGTQRIIRIKEPIALDIQGERSYVVAPPSIHPSGKQYEPEKFQGQPVAEWPHGIEFEEELFKLIKAKYKDFDPQKHREKIDVEQLLEGVSEGGRNDAAIKLATWYRRTGKKAEEAEKELAMWNEKLTEPLPEAELQRTIQSAFDKAEPYKYWFKQNPEASKEIEQYNREEEETAEKLLNSEEILPKVEDALAEVIGETKNKVCVFLLELTDQSIQIGAQASAGKNWLVDHVAELYPKQHIFKITGTTDKAIRYLPDQVGTLYVAEWRATGKKDEETTAQFDLKLVISEGKLRILTVIKDKEKGRWVTKILENDSIKNIISTTTDVKIPQELNTRIWHLSLDETHEQTQRILEHGLKQISLPPSKRMAKEKEKKIFRCAMKKLLSEEVKGYIVPYAEYLNKFFSLHKVRVRRDKDKLLKAIESVASLHRRNRPRLEEYIICMPEDLYWAWQYMDRAISGTFSEKEDRFLGNWKLAKEILNRGKDLTVITYSTILGQTRDTARDWLKRFENAGLIGHKSSGKGGEWHFYKEKDEAKLETVEISMQLVIDITEQWLKDNLKRTEQWKSGRIGIENVNTKIKNKKITLHISTPTLQLFDSLPDAPEGNAVADGNVDASGGLSGERVKVDESFDLWKDGGKRGKKGAKNSE